MAMRLAAQAKLGYYPVQPATLAYICQSIKVPDPDNTLILDPCCGAGLALRDLGAHLKLPKENLYGVELDERRAEQAAEHAHVIHSSFFNARIVPVQSFSLAWVNPPYEDELKQEEGKDRMKLEWSFLEHVQRYVIKGGLLILHMPGDRLSPELCNAFMRCCINVHRVDLPAELKPWRESLLVGVKRDKIERQLYGSYVKTVEAFPEYTLPAGEPIRHFTKTAPTDEEILACLEKAPFWKAFAPSKPKPKLRPVLAMGPGHLGLTLASGHLDGVLKPEGYEPHVVRGIAYKEDFLAKEESTESEDGKVTTTKTYRQNIKLKIRALTADGTIHEKR